MFTTKVWRAAVAFLYPCGIGLYRMTVDVREWSDTYGVGSFDASDALDPLDLTAAMGIFGNQACACRDRHSCPLYLPRSCNRAG